MRNPFSFPDNPFKRADDLLKSLPKEITVKSRFGIGGGGPVARRPAEPKPSDEAPIQEPVAEPVEQKEKVVLRNPKWEAEKVGFNEETDISVEVTLPKEHENKKKILFELYAKAPSGPERISQADGMEESGKAKAKIPVYQPQYKEEDGSPPKKVEYYFTAKHSESELLKDDAATRIIEEMAERLIKSHILQDVNFATDKSFVSPSEAEDLKAMCEEIKGWKEQYPDGKLAVFGHADAVGKEDYNKKLSERRARSVHALLVKDPKAWEALYGEEKWGLSTTQELLKHLGHDPGAIDGQDGAKTKAAVKGFQKSKGLAESGEASAQTREALYQAFMDACNPLTLKDKDFDAIDGKPHAGCSEINLVEKKAGACEPNRRVAVFLLKSNKNFPINYPCKHGDVGACKKQAAKKGDRRTPGFTCHFYDALVTEQAGGGGSKPVGELPDYDPGKVEATEGGCACDEAHPPGELALYNAEWNVEKARCGGTVELTADTSLADGSEVLVKFATEERVCEQVKATASGGKVKLEWKVKGVGFAFNDKKEVLPEVKVFATLEAKGHKAEPEKPLLVQTPVKTEPLEFDKNFSWPPYSVHAHFTQKVWGKAQKVLVKKKVLKTWGATYVNLKDAGITSTIAGMPWAGHRWAKSKTGHMVPDQYWDGSRWKDIPDGVLDNPQSFGAMPLVKVGDKYQHPGSATFEWPDGTFRDYAFDDYANKRNVWIADSNKRWSRVYKLRRKDCTADPKTECCTYELTLEFEMVKTETYDNHTLCLAPGNLRSNAGLLFYGETRIPMCAHEVGHLVGLPDEYPGGAVDPAATGDGLNAGIDRTTLMGGDMMSEANCKVKKRHYGNFLEMAKRLGKEAGGAEQEWVAV